MASKVTEVKLWKIAHEIDSLVEDVHEVTEDYRLIQLVRNLLDSAARLRAIAFDIQDEDIEEVSENDLPF